jgi:hypothetical protein
MTDSMKAASFDIFIENDIPFGGMRLGFQLWGSDGVTWTYPSLPESYGPIPGQGWLTITPGSRLDPPEEAFDMTGLLITEQNVDGQLRDSIILSGVSLSKSLAAGPLEQMISINVDVRLNGYYALGEICFDTSLIPPVGELLFVDVGWQTFPRMLHGPTASDAGRSYGRTRILFSLTLSSKPIRSIAVSAATQEMKC